MAKKTAENPLDFARQITGINQSYPMFQVLDEDGNITREEVLKDLALSDGELITLYSDMLRWRTIDERFEKLARQGRLGFYAPTIGQEASQVASFAAFNDKDFLLGGYRDIPQIVQHGLPLWKAILWSRGHVEGNNYPADLPAVPPQIIIGAQIVQAAGVGLGLKMRGVPQAAVTYTGDGGSSQGDFYEGMNFAGAYQAPVVFIVQNNGYAISTPRHKQTAAETLAQKAAAAGIPGIQVDGMDAFAVLAAARAARAFAVEGNGPVLIETVTSRFGPHSMSGDDPKLYRTQESFDYWAKKDPMVRFKTYLESRGLWDNDKEEAHIALVQDEVKDALAQADAAPKQKVSDFLANMFENPPAQIAEQIEQYREKETA